MTTRQEPGTTGNDVDESDDLDEAIAIGSGGMVQYFSHVVLKVVVIIVLVLVIGGGLCALIIN